MAARPTAAQFTVVDRGQVVVNECISVQALNGDGSGDWISLGGKKVVSGKKQGWTNALAACFHRIAHSGMQSSWSRFGVRQELVDAAFNPCTISF